ncbi:MAG: peptidoglycan -binding protein [Proteobacteria bacterium]|nr:peptidoglycan -binding protein [Pseudomonadota bacterium]
MATLARRRLRDTNIWPGFVDALATMLMVIMFLLMVFVLAQFFLGQALSGRDQALSRLQNQISELAGLLSLEKRSNKDLRKNFAQLSEELQISVALRADLKTTIGRIRQRAEAAERDLTAAQSALKADKSKIAVQLQELGDLSRDIAALRALREELQSKIAEMAGKLEESGKTLLAEKDLSKSARAQVALLNQQTAALRETLAKISAALDASEKRDAEKKIQIASLGKRLNAALASKVLELSRYRSEFFGRLRDLLGGQKGVRIVGDRFVFQSEVLFAKGAVDIGVAGKKQLLQLALTLKQISREIPADIDWILRVDGHTDKDPIKTARFPSNWELSSARAISVVQFLINQGLPPNRLAATGFGEFQPLDNRNDEIAKRQNRRIATNRVFWHECRHLSSVALK